MLRLLKLTYDMYVDVPCKDFSLGSLNDASIDTLILPPHVLYEELTGFGHPMPTPHANSATLWNYQNDYDEPGTPTGGRRNLDKI